MRTIQVQCLSLKWYQINRMLHLQMSSPSAWMHADPLLVLQDIATGAQLTKPIRMTSGDVVWANDNTHLFYLVKDTLDRPYRVYRHALGSSAPDALVFEENDEVWMLALSRAL